MRFVYAIKETNEDGVFMHNTIFSTRRKAENYAYDYTDSFPERRVQIVTMFFE